MIKIHAKSNESVKVKMYGEISRWEYNGKNFSKWFSELDKKYKKINLHLHCYGGEVFEGNVIYNTIANSSAHVTVYIDGVAASMATIVMMAADKIVAAENAFIMVHCPTTLTCGNAVQLLSAAKLLRAMEKNFANEYAEKSGKSLKEINKWFDGNDHWFTAKEAAEKKLIDQVSEKVVKDIKELDKKQAQTLGSEGVYNHFKGLSANEDIPNNYDMNKQDLINKFNLTGVTAESSDTAIHEAIDAKLKIEKEAKEAAEKKLQEQKEAEINSLIAGAGIEEKEQIETYTNIGNTAGIDALKMVLPKDKEKKQEQPRITDLIEGLKGSGGGDGKPDANDRSKWTYDDWTEKDPTGLQKMHEKEPEKFHALLNSGYKEYKQK